MASATTALNVEWHRCIAQATKKGYVIPDDHRSDETDAPLHMISFVANEKLKIDVLMSSASECVQLILRSIPFYYIFALGRSHIIGRGNRSDARANECRAFGEMRRHQITF